MIKSLVARIAIFLFAAISWTQVSPEPAAAPNTTPASAASALAAGTVISVELAKSVDARKIKANDKIEARTAMDLLSHGQIVIPRNTRIVGHVTEAKAHSKQSPDSMVGIAFDRVLMKDGRELPLQAAVQAIARPLQTSPPLNSEDSMGATAAGIPSAAQGQRGTMPGSSASNNSSSYPTGYPSRSNTGASPDPLAPSGSTVSPLGSTSQGVVGMKGLSLNSSGPISVVSSSTENVHLDSGTQLILRVQ